MDIYKLMPAGDVVGLSLKPGDEVAYVLRAMKAARIKAAAQGRETGVGEAGVRTYSAFGTALDGRKHTKREVAVFGGEVAVALDAIQDCRLAGKPDGISSPTVREVSEADLRGLKLAASPAIYIEDGRHSES